MNKEVFSQNITTKPSIDDDRWVFQDIEYQDSKKDKGISIEDDKIISEILPYVEKIEPRMIKKVFDGWKDRRYYYRKLMREEEDMAEFSDTECNAWADLFYLGTIFRDYLDTILDLKRPMKSGFRLLDSTEKEVVEMRYSPGWFSTSEHMINVVGDQFENKHDYLVALAHEMWHAHQAQVAEEENSDRSDAYLEAFNDYIGIENPERNLDQVLEKEAYAFQYFFKYKLSEAMELAPEMNEILFEDDEYGIILNVENCKTMQKIMEKANERFIDSIMDDCDNYSDDDESFDDEDFGDDYFNDYYELYRYDPYQ